MGLAGDNKLHRTLRIGQQTQQPLRVVQQQVRPLIGGETPGETQVSRHWDRTDAGRGPPASAAAPATVNSRARRSRANSTSACAAGGAHLPELGVGDAADVLSPASPSSPASGLFRRPPSRARRPPSESQLGMWTPLVTCPTGTSASGQRGNSGAKMRRLTSPVQPADAVDGPAAPDRQIGHVERLGRIVRVQPAKARRSWSGMPSRLRRNGRDTAR